MRDVRSLVIRWFLVAISGFLFAGSNGMAASAALAGAVKARIEKSYAIVQFADGSKKMVPLASLNDDDRAFVTRLSTEQPLAAGKSMVVVQDTSGAPPKETIVKAAVEGPLETVQLCPPNVMRDQIGATCMLYGRVHWLDIAGYYANAEAIYKVPVDKNPQRPWEDPRYLDGLEALISGFKPKPIVLNLPGYEEDPFDWARRELRKGRPILAALPREIWQALPPNFIAAHPWGGGNVGHQVVINGFTWNSETRQGTFHIINSWAELPEFDLTTENAKGGTLVIEQSMLRKGEPPPVVARETVKSITLLRAVGKTNLYEVETNFGRRKIAAASEEAARTLIENGK